MSEDLQSLDRQLDFIEKRISEYGGPAQGVMKQHQPSVLARLYHYLLQGYHEHIRSRNVPMELIERKRRLEQERDQIKRGIAQPKQTTTKTRTRKPVSSTKPQTPKPVSSRESTTSTDYNTSAADIKGCLFLMRRWPQGLVLVALLALGSCAFQFWTNIIDPATPAIEKPIVAITSGNAHQVEELRRWRTYGPVPSITISRNGTTIGYIGGTRVYLGDVANGKSESLSIGPSLWSEQILFSPDERIMAIVVYNPDTLENSVRLQVRVTVVLHTLEGYTGRIGSLAFSPNGQILASGSEDHTVKLWNVGTGTLTRTLLGHTLGVRSVAFSPDGKTLASGSLDNTVRLWNTEDGTLLHTLRGHTNGVDSVAFSPGGEMLASASWDHTIKLWNVKDGSLLLTWERLIWSANSLAFSPDASILASGSADHTIKLRNPQTGNLLHILEGHGGSVDSIVFSPDGHLLISGSSDGTIRFWGVPSAP